MLERSSNSGSIILGRWQLFFFMEDSILFILKLTQQKIPVESLKVLYKRKLKLIIFHQLYKVLNNHKIFLTLKNTTKEYIEEN